MDEKPNQFGDRDNRRLDCSRWTERWDAGQTNFHLPQVHPMLEKHIELLKAREPKRIFLPMCGKSEDLKWLAEQGHKVLGNEFVELACCQFFEENGIPYQSRPIEGIPGTIFTSTDERYNIILYNCDFFKLNSAILGSLDAIWDRGSLAAVYPDERQRYKDVICDLMNNHTRMLAEVFYVDHSEFSGPPHSFPKEEIYKLFGDVCKIDLIETKDCSNLWKQKWGITCKYFDAQLIFLTKTQ